jgi:TRAP-type C4-dicarboxylate transport system permease small subunit
VIRAPEEDFAHASGLGRGLEALSRVFAFLGGFVFTGLTLISLYSVLMRNLFGAPIQGDFELVQMGCAIAIAACLPLCQMRSGHIIVDFFSQRARPETRRRLDGLGALLLAVAMALFTWRTAIGALDARVSRETSMIMELPTWAGYALMVPSFALAAMVALYIASLHFRGRPIP